MSANSKEAQKLARMGIWATRVLLAIGAVLVVLEFVIHRHGEISLEDLPLFPAIYAFFICIFIVVCIFIIVCIIIIIVVIIFVFRIITIICIFFLFFIRRIKMK